MHECSVRQRTGPLNRPCFMEDSWFKSYRSRDLTGELPIVIFFNFGWGNVTDGLQQSVVVKPGQLFKCGQFQ